MLLVAQASACAFLIFQYLHFTQAEACATKSYFALHRNTIYMIRNQKQIQNPIRKKCKQEGLYERVCEKHMRLQIYRAANALTAFCKRLTTRSCPSTSIVSNSGGATAWPTIATRVALISKPALTPSAAASSRSAWSHAS